MPKIDHIAVQTDSSRRYSVHWQDGTARYHYWTNDPVALVPALPPGPSRGEPVLYKNSLAQRDEPGHFDCRYLRPSTKANAAMIEAARDYAIKNKLVPHAENEAKDREMKRRAEADLAYVDDFVMRLRQFAKSRGGSLDHMSDDGLMTRLRSLWTEQDHG